MDTSELSPTSGSLHTIQPGIVARGEPLSSMRSLFLLHPKDDVAIARVPLSRGVVLRLPGEPAVSIEVAQRVLSGHKVALHAVAEGQPVRRYGSVIGFASRPIAAGEHVHTHNLSVGELQQQYEYGVDVHPVLMCLRGSAALLWDTAVLMVRWGPAIMWRLSAQLIVPPQRYVRSNNVLDPK
ncbi:UxaA family hydrolase [Dictyobacter kobayashii]|uniref:UxaA family hydrolase n=1 Tax=Dictyobacter kobayashii TaxID=2014872 RepID=UPI001C3FA9BB|nr:UxaA family hydrolase [Dictyobacter kobayashii]